MPVRSLNSAVLKWPEAKAVLKEARAWAKKTGRRDKTIREIACFGSIAAGRWGVGSDLDIVIVMRETNLPFHMRGTMFETSEISVPVDVIVYTESEYAALRNTSPGFYQELRRHVKRLYLKEKKRNRGWARIKAIVKTGRMKPPAAKDLPGPEGS